jgi:hypothetical protein
MKTSLENEKEPEVPEPPDPRRKALLAAVFVLLLIGAGVFLTHVLRRMAQIQDCALSGRTNCAPIDSSTAR